MRSSVGSLAASDYAEIEPNPAKQSLMLGNVVFKQRVERFAACGGDAIFSQGLGVAAYVLVVLVAGGRGDQERGGIGVVYGEADLFPAEICPPEANTRTRAWNFSAPAIPCAAPFDAAHNKRVRGFGFDRGLLRRFHAGGERDISRLVGRQTQHDDLIDRAGKYLAGEFHSIGCVGYACHGGVQVQVAAIIFHPFFRGKCQKQIADSLIRHLSQRLGHHFLADKPVRLAVFARKDQGARLGQCRQCVGVVRIIRAAGPQRVFVELYAFFFQSAENHRPQPAVADRQGFDPLRGRIAIPERKRLRAAAFAR